MRNSTLSMLIGTALLASIGTTATAAPKPALRDKDQAPWSRMRKAEPVQRWSQSPMEGQRQKRVASQFTTPTSDTFEYITAPDGSLWYAVCTYDNEVIEHEAYTEYVKKGFTFTIYDSNFNEIGKVRDNIVLEENETRCVQVALASQVTKQFFNNDANYEVMVSFFMNTPEYVVNSRTNAYSIKMLGDGELSPVISTVPGYPIDEINCAKDKWSEDYYITFLTEERPLETEGFESFIDFLAQYKQIMTTYGKGVKPTMTKSVRQIDLPGDQMTCPALLCKKVNGKLTLIYSRYEKTFFENPAGQSDNENITADNNLIIEVYRMNDAYPAEMELISTTKIPTLQHTDNPDVYCTYYGIGNLGWSDDVDFDNYTSDGRPAFVVSTDDYLYSDDDHYNSSYYVYDADGNCIRTIAENTYDYVKMSDLKGFEPQAMFVHMGDDMNFEFVDLYSCQTVTKVDHMYRGYSLTVSTDRVPSGDSYAYASALSYGMPLENDELGAPVCWIDKDGEFIRLDVIPTGKGTELSQLYMNANGLKPYLFNTDSDLEYMMLVKRRVDGLDGLREELIIASPNKGPIYTFTNEEDKGSLRTVYLMDGADPKLLVVFMNDKNQYTTDVYSLPFDASLKGSGTISDPYLITSGGELQLIKNDPSACYKLANDIDCANMDYYPVNEFKGTLDGAGHTIKNLTLATRTNSKTGLFISTTNATVKDLNFYNAKMMLSGSYEAGLIAATSFGTTFDNIHIKGITAIGDKYDGEFGGIAGKSWVKTVFNGCELAAADINLPSSSTMGGIVGDIRTGTNITGCAVSGTLTAGSTLGGIVGSTTTGDEVISQCHVDADLKAENTIGGIVGFLDRSKVKNNYVEGTLEATKPSKWNNTISLGGIAGELEGDWDGSAGVAISQNLIAVSAFTYPSLEGVQAQDPRQLATVHRVAGRTSFNQYLEEEPTKIISESGVYNNYIVSDLAVVDSDTMYKNIEGETIDKYELEVEWLENTLGFSFGTTSATPWNIQSWPAYDPSLYYESIIFIPTQEITVVSGKTFDIEIAIVSREQLTEDDIIGGFMCDGFEPYLEMTDNFSYDGNSFKIEFAAAKEGEANVMFDILGSKANCLVTVIADGSSVEGIEAISSALAISNGIVTAEGHAITVYDINGKALLSGHDYLDARSLSSGIYVAVAKDQAGKTTAKKFVK